MRIHGYVVFWSRLLGSLNCAIGFGLIFAPSITLGLMGLAPDSYSMLLSRLIGVVVLAMGNLYFFGLSESRRYESYEPLRQIWIVTAWVYVCVSLVAGGSIHWSGIMTEGIVSFIAVAVIGGWQLTSILIGRFPNHE